VALKYLREEIAGDVSARRRFLREARITAQLQHPGIPPIYEVGELPDKRPFLAMKLIQGQNLDDLLKQHGASPTRWLGEFEAICQAVGYAHAEGVIHRDLKPGNVMVGAFGEVQVMDWGLAKVLVDAPVTLTQYGEEDSWGTVPPTAGKLTPDYVTASTELGRVMGTPAFMSPEQAIGAAETVDRRSDVFGLGAILCFLLTGKPPFVAPDRESARRLAAMAKLADAFARLDDCGAEPELIALAKRCLSAEKEERPADGGDLAEAVGELRREAEERARQAELDKIRAAVRAAERRGWQQLLVAVALLIAVALGAGVTRIINVYRYDADVKEAWAAAAKHRQVAEVQRDEAEQAADLERQRFQQALDAFSDLLGSTHENSDKHPATREQLEKAVARLNVVFAQKPEVASELLGLRVRALLHRKKIGDAIKTAECWASLTELSDSQRYEAARALALCAGVSKKEALGGKAIAVLSKSRESEYFKNPKRLALIEQDPDFVAIRDHPDFVKFVQSLKEK
jgi:hypothetical protein